MTTQTAAVTFASLTTKKARIAYVREALATSEKWAVRGLIRIFENQTEDEQALTSLATKVNKGYKLSDKQMVWVYKKMPKYAKQLVESIPTAQ